MKSSLSSRRAAPAMLAGLAVLVGGVARTTGGAPPDADEKTVRLAIDFGDGVELHFTQLGWRQGLTVADALALASRHKRGVPVKTKGTGAATLVVQIGDLANEGGGRTARNWLFYVDGERAEVGAGACELARGQRVLWKFAPYE